MSTLLCTAIILTGKLNSWQLNRLLLQHISIPMNELTSREFMKEEGMQKKRNFNPPIAWLIQSGKQVLSLVANF